MKRKYIKEEQYDRPLAKGKYWDTIKLDNGGLIRVIKLRRKFYPKGY